MKGRGFAGLFYGYILASVLAILSGWQGWWAIHVVSKPAMLILLSVWFFLNSRVYGNRFTLLVQAGLFFSLVGDIALMFTARDEFFFLIGLAMFLIAQLCYMVAFALNISDAKAPWQGMLIPVLCSLPVLAFAYWYSGFLMPRVDSDITPAIWAYLLVISGMFCTAAFRWQRTYKRSWLLVLIGALVFIASDTLLSYDRFISELEHGPLLILSTYAIAQLLIAIGCVWHVRSPTHIRQQEVLNA